MASAKLTKTYSSSSNRRTYTLSLWAKFASIGTNLTLANIGPFSGDNEFRLRRDSNNRMEIYDYGSSAYKMRIRTNRLFTDLNGWYHIVAAVDTTQGTVSDRLKLYINGVQETSYSAETQANSNLETAWGIAQNYTLAAHESGDYMDGQIAHFHYVDGTAHTPTTFGETDATTGIWKPKTAPSVTYGSNGFFLKFDNSANMGLDSGGGGNNWTTNGTIIQNKDTPSNVFATLNPNARRITSNNPTYSNTNSSLQGQTGNGQNNNAIATLGDLAKGKYYFECKVGTVGNDFGVGVSDTPANSDGSLSGNHEILYKNDGTKWNGSSYVSYGASYTTNDIIGCAFDVTAGTISFYKNGVSQGTAATDLASSLVHGYTPGGYTNHGLMHFNFGNGYFGTTAVSSAQNPTDGVGIFEYTPPTNYRAVCTKSINAQEYS